MILFLDFDGVTHGEPSLDADAFCQLPRIELVLREFPAVEIVISSTWRLDWVQEEESLQEMRKLFANDIAPRVVGVTPDLSGKRRSDLPANRETYLREWECFTWLQHHRSPDTPWLALDDRAGWFSPDSPHAMIVDGGYGFMPQDAYELRRRLRQLGAPAGDKT